MWFITKQYYLFFRTFEKYFESFNDTRSNAWNKFYLLVEIFFTYKFIRIFVTDLVDSVVARFCISRTFYRREKRRASGRWTWTKITRSTWLETRGKTLGTASKIASENEQRRQFSNKLIVDPLPLTRKAAVMSIEIQQSCPRRVLLHFLNSVKNFYRNLFIEKVFIPFHNNFLRLRKLINILDAKVFFYNVGKYSLWRSETK